MKVYIASMLGGQSACAILWSYTTVVDTRCTGRGILALGLPGKISMLLPRAVCMKYFMSHGNVIMDILNMSSTNDEDGKDSDGYGCIIVHLKVFVLVMCIGFEALMIHFLYFDGIIWPSIVIIDAGSSSAAFVSPMSFIINNKGNVYPFGFEPVFQFILVRDTEVNKVAAEIV